MYALSSKVFLGLTAVTIVITAPIPSDHTGAIFNVGNDVGVSDPIINHFKHHEKRKEAKEIVNNILSAVEQNKDDLIKMVDDVGKAVKTVTKIIKSATKSDSKKSNEKEKEKQAEATKQQATLQQPSLPQADLQQTNLQAAVSANPKTNNAPLAELEAANPPILQAAQAQLSVKPDGSNQF